MKLKPLFVFLLLSIIITSCNTSNKVVSSSFIQKRKYTKGYHFDLTSKRAVSHQPLAISRKYPSTAKEKESVERNFTKVSNFSKVYKDENLISYRIKNLSGNNHDLSASVDNGSIIIQQKNILADDNFIGQKDNTIEKTDTRILNQPGFIGFLLSVFGVFCIVLVFWLGSISYPDVEAVVIIISFFSFLVGFVLSLIGIIQIENDEKYKGEGYALTGFLLNIIGGAFIIYLIIALSHDM